MRHPEREREREMAVIEEVGSHQQTEKEKMHLVHHACLSTKISMKQLYSRFKAIFEIFDT